MTDDQLIESLRARTWPGDCEAAAFRLEELRARVAELEALPGNVLARRVERLESELKPCKSNHAAEVQIGQLLAERDALAAELTALRKQEPVAWGDEPWMASFGVRVGRDSSNSIDLVFTIVWQRKFQLYAKEAAYLRWLLNKAEIPGYPNTHPSPPVPARELTDADIGRCIASADRSFAQEPISGSPVLGVWSRHLARAIERHMRGEGE